MGKFNFKKLAGLDDRSSASPNDSASESVVDVELIESDDGSSTCFDYCSDTSPFLNSIARIEFNQFAGARDAGHPSTYFNSAKRSELNKFASVND